MDLGNKDFTGEILGFWKSRAELLLTIAVTAAYVTPSECGNIKPRSVTTLE